MAKYRSISEIPVELRTERHTLEAVLARTSFTEEQIYFLLNFAEHHGYSRAVEKLHPWPLSRWRQRNLLWVGGWEPPALLVLKGLRRWTPRRTGASGRPRWTAPYPITILRRLTLYGWGWDLSLGRFGTLVWSKWNGLYVSPNGTPDHERARVLIPHPRRRRT